MTRLPAFPRVHFRKLPFALSFLFVLFAVPNAFHVQTPELQIHYTARLFGYYRIEPREDLRLSTVRKFLWSLARTNPRTDTLLLGMGDNFGPEFGASIQLSAKRGVGCFSDRRVMGRRVT
jgi:hypothetical protein